jgi:hypothetical protein
MNDTRLKVTISLQKKLRTNPRVSLFFFSNAQIKMTKTQIPTTTTTTANIFQNPCLPAHVHAVLHDQKSYLAHLNFLIESKAFTTIPSSVRATIIVTLHTTSSLHKKQQGNGCSSKALLTKVLLQCDVTDIVPALTRLDMNREARQLEKKIALIERNHPHLLPLDSIQEHPSKNDSCAEADKQRRRRCRKVDIYRNKLAKLQKEIQETCQISSRDVHCIKSCHDDTAVQEIIASAPGASGAFARKIRHWAKSVRGDALEFIMLSMPHRRPWKIMADIVHFHPSDFSIPYFLSDVFDKQIPTDSFVAQMRHMVAEYDTNNSQTTKAQARAWAPALQNQFLHLASEHPQVYLAFPYLRTLSFLKTKRIYEHLAAHVPVEVVLWNMEEFHQIAPECGTIVRKRLSEIQDGTRRTTSDSNYSKVLSFGKLMERILTFRHLKMHGLAEDLAVIAEDRLRHLKSYWREKTADKKVAVVGDASSSMQVAIQSAAIFASMVSVCLNAELSFYNQSPVPSPHPKPSNVKETLHICETVRANGCTAPAAALWQYVRENTYLDLIVHVTDEEENTPYHGHTHAEVLAKYKKRVNSQVKLVIVTVGSGDRKFRQDLARHGIEYETITIDANRPDLTKFESMLGRFALILGLNDVPQELLDNGKKESEGEFVLV